MVFLQTMWKIFGKMQAKHKRNYLANLFGIILWKETLDEFDNILLQIDVFY